MKNSEQASDEGRMGFQTQGVHELILWHCECDTQIHLLADFFVATGTSRQKKIAMLNMGIRIGIYVLHVSRIYKPLLF